MKISMSEITTLPAALADDLPAFAAAGFADVEIQVAKVQAYLRDHEMGELIDLLQRLNLNAVGAIGLAPQGPALLLSEGGSADSYLAGLRQEFEICRALGIGAIGIGADAARWSDGSPWQSRAIANLRRAGRMAADHGLRIGVEFMSLGAPVGPFVLDTLAETRSLVGEAGDPAVGVNVDFFHHYRGGGTVGELAALDGDEIVCVHVTDCGAGDPETLGDGDRLLPGDGVLRLAAYRDAILGTGYDGFWAIELLNEALWSRPLGEVADVCLARMRTFAGISPEGMRSAAH